MLLTKIMSWLSNDNMEGEKYRTQPNPYHRKCSHWCRALPPFPSLDIISLTFHFSFRVIRAEVLDLVMVLAFTSSSGRSMRYSPTFSNPHSHSHCLPSPLLFQSSLPQRFNVHSLAVKPIKRVRCELQAKVNGTLSADSDPRFIDRQGRS